MACKTYGDCGLLVDVVELGGFDDAELPHAANSAMTAISGTTVLDLKVVEFRFEVDALIP